MQSWFKPTEKDFEIPTPYTLLDFPSYGEAQNHSALIEYVTQPSKVYTGNRFLSPALKEFVNYTVENRVVTPTASSPKKTVVKQIYVNKKPASKKQNGNPAEAIAVLKAVLAPYARKEEVQNEPYVEETIVQQAQPQPQVQPQPQIKEDGLFAKLLSFFKKTPEQEAEDRARMEAMVNSWIHGAVGDISLLTKR